MGLWRCADKEFCSASTWMGLQWIRYWHFHANTCKLYVNEWKLRVFTKRMLKSSTWWCHQTVYPVQILYNEPMYVRVYGFAFQKYDELDFGFDLKWSLDDWLLRFKWHTIMLLTHLSTFYCNRLLLWFKDECFYFSTNNISQHIKNRRLRDINRFPDAILIYLWLEATNWKIGHDEMLNFQIWVDIFKVRCLLISTRKWWKGLCSVSLAYIRHS